MYRKFVLLYSALLFFLSLDATCQNSSSFALGLGTNARLTENNDTHFSFGPSIAAEYRRFLKPNLSFSVMLHTDFNHYEKYSDLEDVGISFRTMVIPFFQHQKRLELGVGLTGEYRTFLEISEQGSPFAGYDRNKLFYPGFDIPFRYLIIQNGLLRVLACYSAKFIVDTDCRPYFNYSNIGLLVEIKI